MKKKIIIGAAGLLLAVGLPVIAAVLVLAGKNRTEQGAERIDLEVVKAENGQVASWAGEQALYRYPTDTTADEVLAQVKEDGFVVMEDSDITSGEAVWHAFFERTRKGEDACVQIAHYYTLDKERVSEELYEQEKDSYPKLFLGSLLYYEDEYWYIVKASNTEEIENGDFVRYKYLMKYEGEPSSKSALFSTYEYYVLVNDSTLTWKELEWGMLSSQMGDFIPHRKIISKYYYD